MSPQPQISTPVTSGQQGQQDQQQGQQGQPGQQRVRVKKTRGAHKRKLADVSHADGAGEAEEKSVAEQEEGEIAEVSEAADAPQTAVPNETAVRRALKLQKTHDAVREIGIGMMTNDPDFFNVRTDKLYESAEDAKADAPSGVPCIRLYRDALHCVDQNAPPERSQSAYLRFCGARRDTYKGMGFSEVTKRLGEDWATLPAAEKQKFEREAAERKAELARLKQDYQNPEGYHADGRLLDAVPKNATSSLMKRALRNGCNSIRVCTFYKTDDAK